MRSSLLQSRTTAQSVVSGLFAFLSYTVLPDCVTNSHNSYNSASIVQAIYQYLAEVTIRKRSNVKVNVRDSSARMRAAKRTPELLDVSVYKCNSRMYVISASESASASASIWDRAARYGISVGTRRVATAVVCACACAQLRLRLSAHKA